MLPALLFVVFFVFFGVSTLRSRVPKHLATTINTKPSDFIQFKKKMFFFLLVWNFSKRSGSALMCKVWQPMWKVQAFLFQPSPSVIWTRWDYIPHPPSFLTLTTGYWMEKRQQQWWGIVWTEKYLRLWQRHRDLEGLCQEQDIHPGGHDMGEWNFCQRLWRSSGIWEDHGVCEFLPMDILDDDHHVWLLSHPGLS